MLAKVFFVALFCFVLAHVVAANTEKTIFLGPKSIVDSGDHTSLNVLNLTVISPNRASIRVKLQRTFSSGDSPKGSESWYSLSNLEPGRRYEVRTCWAANQPTEFWLKTYEMPEVHDNALLMSSLMSYYDKKLQNGPIEVGPVPEYPQRVTPVLPAGQTTSLFLRIHAAADYFTTNETMMLYPPDVDVDIILDPYLFNLLPQSLAWTVVYITVLAVVSWLIAQGVWRFIFFIKEDQSDRRTSWQIKEKVHAQ